MAIAGLGGLGARGRIDGRRLLVIAELALLAALAVAVARLVWTLVTPLGPLGSQAPVAPARAVDTSLLGKLDPFFGTSVAAGPMVVSDLNLDVFGVRVDNVSGRGSAIIAADGEPQRSVFVGEEVMPGVKLHSVAFDSVTIDRSGTLEQLFLDQSVPAQPVAVTPVRPAATTAKPAAAAGDAPVAGPAIKPDELASHVSATPVMKAGKYSGLKLEPAGDGAWFRAYGLQPGDVLTGVNGVRLDSAERAESLGRIMAEADAADLEIQRGNRVLSVSIGITQ
jgi:general secretion pathway protein C